jgi:hypothetical protein
LGTREENMACVRVSSVTCKPSKGGEAAGRGTQIDSPMQ